MLRPENSIEVGVFRGATTVAITAALCANEYGTHYGVDYDADLLAETTGHVKDAGYADRFVPVQGMSTAPEVAQALPEQAGLIFIDACHTYEAVRDDFDAFSPRLAPGGIMAFHDTIGIEGPRRVMLDEGARGGWEIVTIATTGGSGISLVWRK